MGELKEICKAFVIPNKGCVWHGLPAEVGCDGPKDTDAAVYSKPEKTLHYLAHLLLTAAA